MQKTDIQSIKDTLARSDIRFDSVDMAILGYLAGHEHATVTEIERAIGNVSHTLVFYRLLTFKSAGLVVSRRKSRNAVLYSLKPKVQPVCEQIVEVKKGIET